MKTIGFIFLCLVAAGAALLSSCADSYEKITAPDGTVTERQRRELDRETVHFVGDVARAYSPRRIPDRAPALVKGGDK